MCGSYRCKLTPRRDAASTTLAVASSRTASRSASSHFLHTSLSMVHIFIRALINVPGSTRCSRASRASRRSSTSPCRSAFLPRPDGKADAATSPIQLCREPGPVRPWSQRHVCWRRQEAHRCVHRPRLISGVLTALDAAGGHVMVRCSSEGEFRFVALTFRRKPGSCVRDARLPEEGSRRGARRQAR